jgi:hypothetical protein
MQKERYVPKGAIKVAAKNSPAFVFIYEAFGYPCVQAFPSERAIKPCARYRFPSPAKREAWVKGFFEGQAARAALKADRAAKRKEWENPYKVGDILKGSWGYDQTNIDFFEIVAVKGKMLEIRELKQARYGDGFGGSSKCVPLPGDYVGSAYRIRAQENLRSPIYGGLWKVEPAVIGGVPVYDAVYWSNDR